MLADEPQKVERRSRNEGQLSNHAAPDDQPQQHRMAGLLLHLLIRAVGGRLGVVWLLFRMRKIGRECQVVSKDPAAIAIVRASGDHQAGPRQE